VKLKNYLQFIAVLQKTIPEGEVIREIKSFLFLCSKNIVRGIYGTGEQPLYPWTRFYCPQRFLAQVATHAPHPFGDPTT
jgi:hypothetical protein